MKVKEIIKSCVELLGISLTERNLSILLERYNIIENEVAVDYFPISTVDKVEIKDGKINYSDLSKNAWQILSVNDEKGKSIKTRFMPTHIEIAKPSNELYAVVEYNYAPRRKGFNDECEYGDRWVNILKYGVCSEYCMSIGDFRKAREFSDKYGVYINILYYERKNNFCGE